MRAPIERPWCCPERTCQPVFQIGDPDPAQPGESWSCFGKMAEPIEFTYAGMTHRNDLRSCHFTPLKGLVAYQENEEDWGLAAFGYEMALWTVRGKPEGMRTPDAERGWRRPNRWRWLKRSRP